MINDDRDVSYVKFHWKSQQRISNLSADQVMATQSKYFQHFPQVDISDEAAFDSTVDQCHAELIEGRERMLPQRV
jgi:hypothetical protein